MKNSSSKSCFEKAVYVENSLKNSFLNRVVLGSACVSDTSVRGKRLAVGSSEFCFLDEKLKIV